MPERRMGSFPRLPSICPVRTRTGSAIPACCVFGEQSIRALVLSISRLQNHLEDMLRQPAGPTSEKLIPEVWARSSQGTPTLCVPM